MRQPLVTLPGPGRQPAASERRYGWNSHPVHDRTAFWPAAPPGQMLSEMGRMMASISTPVNSAIRCRVLMPVSLSFAGCHQYMRKISPAQREKECRSGKKAGITSAWRCRERRMIPMQQNKNEGVNAGQGVFRHSVTAYAAQMTAIC